MELQNKEIVLKLRTIIITGFIVVALLVLSFIGGSVSHPNKVSDNKVNASFSENPSSDVEASASEADISGEIQFFEIVPISGYYDNRFDNLYIKDANGSILQTIVLFGHSYDISGNKLSYSLEGEWYKASFLYEIVDDMHTPLECEKKIMDLAESCLYNISTEPNKPNGNVSIHEKGGGIIYTHYQNNKTNPYLITKYQESYNAYDGIVIHTYVLIENVNPLKYYNSLQYITEKEAAKNEIGIIMSFLGLDYDYRDFN